MRDAESPEKRDALVPRCLVVWRLPISYTQTLDEQEKPSILVESRGRYLEVYRLVPGFVHSDSFDLCWGVKHFDGLPSCYFAVIVCSKTSNITRH